MHEALNRLEAHNPVYARIVVLKIFCGFSIAEIAKELRVSQRTIYRSWEGAKARLYEEITNPE